MQLNLYVMPVTSEGNTMSDNPKITFDLKEYLDDKFKEQSRLHAAHAERTDDHVRNLSNQVKDLSSTVTDLFLTVTNVKSVVDEQTGKLSILQPIGIAIAIALGTGALAFIVDLFLKWFKVY